MVQPRPKTAAGWRVVALPTFAVDMVRARTARHAGDCLHRPAAHALRDPSNASGDLRQLLDTFDCDACARTGYQLEADGRSS